MRWRRVASTLPNNSNVTCSGSSAITDNTCGPLTIRRSESSTILRRSLPELRQCPHEDSASLVAIPFSLLVAIVCAVRSLAHNLQSQSVGLRSPDRNGDQDVAHGIL